MKTLYERIKESRKKIGMTQDELAQQMGYKSRSTIAKIEAGENDITQSKIVKFAKVLNVTPAYLMGWEDEGFDAFSISEIMPMPETVKVPLLGDIACGEPILAEENIEDYVSILKSIKCDFCLRCKGDSMINARINDGDIVCVKQQPLVNNGEIAAILIENEATLKRFYKYGDTIVLRAENPDFKDLEYKNNQLDGIKVIGKATHFISTIK